MANSTNVIRPVGGDIDLVGGDIDWCALTAWIPSVGVRRSRRPQRRPQ
jgi:hypothetical protein